MLESFTFTIDYRTKKWGNCHIYKDNGNTSANVYLNNSLRPLRTAIHELLHIALWEIGGIPPEIQKRKKVEKLVTKIASDIVRTNNIICPCYR